MQSDTRHKDLAVSPKKSNKSVEKRCAPPHKESDECEAILMSRLQTKNLTKKRKTIDKSDEDNIAFQISAVTTVEEKPTVKKDDKVIVRYRDVLHIGTVVSIDNNSGFQVSTLDSSGSTNSFKWPEKTMISGIAKF